MKILTCSNLYPSSTRQRHGIRVHYPCYLSLPKIGMGMAFRSMVMASQGQKALFERILAEQAS